MLNEISMLKQHFCSLCKFVRETFAAFTYDSEDINHDIAKSMDQIQIHIQQTLSFKTIQITELEREKLKAVNQISELSTIIKKNKFEFDQREDSLNLIEREYKILREKYQHLHSEVENAFETSGQLNLFRDALADIAKAIISEHDSGVETEKVLSLEAVGIKQR